MDRRRVECDDVIQKISVNNSDAISYLPTLSLSKSEAVHGVSKFDLPSPEFDVPHALVRLLCSSNSTERTIAERLIDIHKLDDDIDPHKAEDIAAVLKLVEKGQPPFDKETLACTLTKIQNAAQRHALLEMINDGANPGALNQIAKLLKSNVEADGLAVENLMFLKMSDSKVADSIISRLNHPDQQEFATRLLHLSFGLGKDELSAMVTLMKTGEPSSVGKISHLLQSDNEDDLAAGARLLRLKSSSPELFDVSIKMLESDARTTLGVLARFGEPDQIKSLFELAQDKNNKSAVDILLSCPLASARELLDLRKSHLAEDVTTANRLLKLMNGDLNSAHDALILLERTDRDSREILLSRLEHPSTKEAMRALFEELSTGSRAERLEAQAMVDYLGRTATGENATKMLKLLAGDSTSRNHARIAFNQAGAAEKMGALLVLFNSTVPLDQARAAVIAKLFDPKSSRAEMGAAAIFSVNTDHPLVHKLLDRLIKTPEDSERLCKIITALQPPELILDYLLVVEDTTRPQFAKYLTDTLSGDNQPAISRATELLTVPRTVPDSTLKNDRAVKEAFENPACKKLVAAILDGAQSVGMCQQLTMLGQASPAVRDRLVSLYEKEPALAKDLLLKFEKGEEIAKFMDIYADPAYAGSIPVLQKLAREGGAQRLMELLCTRTNQEYLKPPAEEILTVLRNRQPKREDVIAPWTLGSDQELAPIFKLLNMPVPVTSLPVLKRLMDTDGPAASQLLQLARNKNGGAEAVDKFLRLFDSGKYEEKARVLLPYLDSSKTRDSALDLIQLSSHSIDLGILAESANTPERLIALAKLLRMQTSRDDQFTDEVRRGAATVTAYLQSPQGGEQAKQIVDWLAKPETEPLAQNMLKVLTPKVMQLITPLPGASAPEKALAATMIDLIKEPGGAGVTAVSNLGQLDEKSIKLVSAMLATADGKQRALTILNSALRPFAVENMFALLSNPRYAEVGGVLAELLAKRSLHAPVSRLLTDRLLGGTPETSALLVLLSDPKTRDFGKEVLQLGQSATALYEIDRLVKGTPEDRDKLAKIVALCKRSEITYSSASDLLELASLDSTKLIKLLESPAHAALAKSIITTLGDPDLRTFAVRAAGQLRIEDPENIAHVGGLLARWQSNENEREFLKLLISLPPKDAIFLERRMKETNYSTAAELISDMFASDVDGFDHFRLVHRLLDLETMGDSGRARADEIWRLLNDRSTQAAALRLWRKSK